MKVKMRLALLFVCSIVSAGAADPLVEASFEHFYNLEYDEALAGFRKAAAREPDASEHYNHIAQTILYREMYRSGALESELVTGSNPFLRRPKMNPSAADQKAFDDAVARSIELADRRLASNPKDTRALYARGVAFGLRANYNFLVKKAWMDALRDATEARKLHNRVTELDPQFIDARMVQGVHDYVVGSLPLAYKLLGFLVGFRGDREEGIRTLRLVAEKGKLNKHDAQVLLAAIYRRERRPKDALPLVQSLAARFPRNYLFQFEIAQMQSDLGNKREALAALQRVEDLKRSGSPGYARLKYEKIYFSRGTVQFWYGDLDDAVQNFQRVAARTDELDLNTGVMAWMRLGQIHDLKGQRPQAVEAYRKVIALAPQSEAAKESRRYMSSPYRREASANTGALGA